MNYDLLPTIKNQNVVYRGALCCQASPVVSLHPHNFHWPKTVDVFCSNCYSSGDNPDNRNCVMVHRGMIKIQWWPSLLSMKNCVPSGIIGITKTVVSIWQRCITPPYHGPWYIYDIDGWPGQSTLVPHSKHFSKPTLSSSLFLLLYQGTCSSLQDGEGKEEQESWGKEKQDWFPLSEGGCSKPCYMIIHVTTCHPYIWA